MIAAAAGLLLPTGAHADAEMGPRSPASVVFDVVLLRPLGLLRLVIGAAFFVPAAVVASPGGFDSIEEALELFVLVPAEDLLERPLGDF
ncbi:MAG: hypothetical protein V3T64_11190 [Myxococcota bacterium]